MPVDRVEPAPLSARSVVLSLVLGAHPSPLTARDLAGLGELFAVPAGALRVALGRCVTAGELVRTGDGYVVGPQLARRQHQQEVSTDPELRPWGGEWHTAVVVVTGRQPSDRAALRDQLTAARLAELREGVWLRPANLGLPADLAANGILMTFHSVPDGDPAELAARLWDVPGWAADGHRLLRRLRRKGTPGTRLATAAAVVRHLRADPILPPRLQPRGWPADQLRAGYRAYRDELASLISAVP